ncbi:F-box only protein 15 isoform X2 [Mustela putorius furo]|uniref:F-box only protein 15 isoform X2 n=2 Tax=Mustela putorius furo TaxID=9669 RepID=A0A8U0SSC7_MUSPF|nr:F-box only protein 15 isoform X2 [Mustela putorius furo]
MATGRGRLLQLYWRGLQALRLPPGGVGAATGPDGEAAGPAGFRERRSGGGEGPDAEGRGAGGCRRAPRGCSALLHGKGPGARSASRAVLNQCARRGKHCEQRPKDRLVSLERMPPEILLKIFSYLDAVTLLCTGCVNRRFYHLANDNFIWFRIYTTAFSPKRCNWKVNSAEKTAVSMKSLSVEDKEAGYWKKEFITKQRASVKAVLAQVLQPVNPDTGLPVKTKEALRISGLCWVIILKAKNGQEYVMEHTDVSVHDSSVTILWYGKNWPQLAMLAALDLCGVTPVFMDRSKAPSKNGPRWHSLIAKYNLSNLTESTMIGWDSLIRIFCLHPGLLVGLWKREEELAFVMANLHFHHLVEKSTLGSATVPYELPPHTPLLDDHPEYGLHGYQLHVDMHSGGIFYLCGTFRNLFTKKGSIENGYVKLVVIRFKNNTEHLPLIGKFGLSWRTDVFDGCIKSCSIMDVTLLDEYGKPFWCFSSPVCMRSSGPSDGPNFLGQTYCVDYVDSEGKVHVELVWIKETEEYFIVSLVLYLRTAKINQWFGTAY